VCLSVAQLLEARRGAGTMCCAGCLHARSVQAASCVRCSNCSVLHTLCVFSQALESSLAEAFDCALDHGVITIASSLPGGGDVGDLWGAMELAGVAERHLTIIAGE
jgi:hypothetical protein